MARNLKYLRNKWCQHSMRYRTIILSITMSSRVIFYYFDLIVDLPNWPILASPSKGIWNKWKIPFAVQKRKRILRFSEKWKGQPKIILISKRKLKLQVEIEVSTSSFDFEFPLRVCTSSFDFEFPLQVSTSSFDFELRLQVSISSFDFEFRVSISSFDFELRLRISSFNFEFFHFGITQCRPFPFFKSLSQWERKIDENDAPGLRGTPTYMAPEMLTASGDITAKADLWSMGRVDNIISLLFFFVKVSITFQDKFLNFTPYKFWKKNNYSRVRIKPGFLGKFCLFFLPNFAENCEIWLKIGEIWLNSSSQKIPGLMSYAYLTVP